jgi:hypothetical protein
VSSHQPRAHIAIGTANGGTSVRLSSRSLYKRIFDFSLGELGERADYSKMQQEFTGTKRASHAIEIQKLLLSAIDSQIKQYGEKTITTSESAARTRLQELSSLQCPLIVVDFPNRGLPEETNFPAEISDVRRLQVRNASVRVFATPELHELVLRYLDAQGVDECVSGSLPYVAPGVMWGS